MSKVALVVDDSKVVRKIMGGILSEFGFTITEAEDGAVAMTQAKQTRPDLVMLDWNMPVKNGMEFLQDFRMLKEYADVPVIMCTTENEMTKIMEAMSIGANEYVMKPFDKVIIGDKLLQLGLIQSM